MRTRLKHLGERLRVNFWLVPGLFVVGAIGLAALTLRLDAQHGEALREHPLLFSGGPGGAQAVLTAIASSMIGVTGVIFSITMVTLSLASQQFGPRLLRGFVRDRANQVVLGVFMATFTFSLLALRSLDAPGNEDPVPELTVSVSVLLSLLSLALLIFFVHHIATGIQADTLIAQVSKDLHAAIEELYPEGLGESLSADDVPRLPEGFEEDSVPLRAQRTGYVQAIEQEGLLEVLKDEDAVLRLDVRPGDFIVAGSVVGRVLAQARREKLLERLSRSVIVGRKPTPEQDVEFVVGQLVEVAVRALSPGINDPFTAGRAVDRLSAALCDLSRRRFPSAGRKDEDGTLRVLTRRVTWPGIVDTAFDSIRQHGARDVSLTIRIVEGLVRVAECLPPEDSRLRPLRAQVEQVRAAGRGSGWSEEDQRELQDRLSKFDQRVAAG